MIVRRSALCHSGLAGSMLLVCGLIGGQALATDEQPAIDRHSRIAVFPTANLSAERAPMPELRALVRDSLDLRGLKRVDPSALGRFLADNRLRYTGGVSDRVAEGVGRETGAAAVLLTSIHSYSELDPPSFAMSARLVSASSPPRILWMEEVGLAGDQKPGVLALGMVRDVETLRDRALTRVFDSLLEFMSGGPPDRLPPLRAQNRFRPKRFYRTPERPEAADARIRVAVLPFINDSQRRLAADVVMEQFVFRFWETGRVEVIEPGVVRHALLQNRLIRDEGLTTTQIYVLSAELNIDLIVSGDVADYVEASGFGGVPVISFTSRAIDARRGIVSWTAISNNRGSDGSGLFAAKSVRGGHALASQMIRAVVATALDPRGGSKNSIPKTPAATTTFGQRRRAPRDENERAPR